MVAQMRSTFTFQCKHCGKPKKQAASKCPCRRELKLKEQKEAQQKEAQLKKAQTKEKAQPASAAMTLAQVKQEVAAGS